MTTLRYGLIVLVALATMTAPLATGVTAAQTGETAPGAATVSGGSDLTESAGHDGGPPDPEEDVLGWEDGYWHNESIDVNPEDGLNDTELEAVVARSMARVEYVRQLEFEETPPVEVISRDEFADRTGARYENVSTDVRLRHNVKWEAVFMVGEDESSLAVEQSNTAGGVGGFYDLNAEEIKVVSNNVSTPKLDEITLSQELFHALQDQKFDIASFNQSTRELHNAKDGIIEGDGNYVDYLYKQECDSGIWEGTCLQPEDSGAPEGFDPHFGLYQITLQPYSSGPSFVAHLHRTEGWEAVNDVYENPPASTEQLIHPEKYGEDEPTAVSIEDTSQEPWRQLGSNQSGQSANGSVQFAQFGEAGLYVALWYPGVQTQGSTQIIPVNDHINRTSGGGVSQIEPYFYNHPATAGWDGDKLVPYVTDESAETNETGYVYKLVWDSESDAGEFREHWLELMEHHGAESVDGYQDTYRIPDENEFGDAFYLAQNGDTVTIVNGPSVSDLSLIHEGAAPEADDENGDGSGEEGSGEGDADDGMDDDSDEEGSNDGSDEEGSNDGSGEEGSGEGDADDGMDDDSDGSDAGDGMDDETDEPTESGDEDGPGFTFVVALLALVIGTLAVTRRVA